MNSLNGILPKGSTRAIALVYWNVVTLLMPVWFPGGVPDTANKIYVTVGILLTALGFGRATVNKMIEKKAGK